MSKPRAMQDRALSRLLPFAVLALATPLFAQQGYVSRYDAYAGYAYFNSPKVGLPENGFQFQVAVRPKTWYSIGFDYSNASGDLTLKPNLLLTSLQQQLGAQFAQLAAAGLLPPGYQLAVPAHSNTQTFAAGPQISIRRWKSFTPFIRPAIGYLRESATPQPKDLIATGVVHQLAPTGKKIDWAPFFGVGGGVDLNFSKHVVFRMQADFVNDHLFSDLLKDRRNTVRIGIGPAFNFGRNIVD